MLSISLYQCCDSDFMVGDRPFVAYTTVEVVIFPRDVLTLHFPGFPSGVTDSTGVQVCRLSPRCNDFAVR